MHEIVTTSLLRWAAVQAPKDRGAMAAAKDKKDRETAGRGGCNLPDELVEESNYESTTLKNIAVSHHTAAVQTLNDHGMQAVKKEEDNQDLVGRENERHGLSNLRAKEESIGFKTPGIVPVSYRNVSVQTSNDHGMPAVKKEEDDQEPAGRHGMHSSGSLGVKEKPSESATLDIAVMSCCNMGVQTLNDRSMIGIKNEEDDQEAVRRRYMLLKPDTGIMLSSNTNMLPLLDHGADARQLVEVMDADGHNGMGSESNDQSSIDESLTRASVSTHTNAHLMAMSLDQVGTERNGKCYAHSSEHVQDAYVNDHNKNGQSIEFDFSALGSTVSCEISGLDDLEMELDNDISVFKSGQYLDEQDSNNGETAPGDVAHTFVDDMSNVGVKEMDKTIGLTLPIQSKCVQDAYGNDHNIDEELIESNFSSLASTASCEICGLDDLESEVENDISVFNSRKYLNEQENKNDNAASGDVAHTFLGDVSNVGRQEKDENMELVLSIQSPFLSSESASADLPQAWDNPTHARVFNLIKSNTTERKELVARVKSSVEELGILKSTYNDLVSDTEKVLLELSDSKVTNNALEATLVTKNDELATMSLANASLILEVKEMKNQIAKSSPQVIAVQKERDALASAKIDTKAASNKKNDIHIMALEGEKEDLIAENDVFVEKNTALEDRCNGLDRHVEEQNARIELLEDEKTVKTKLVMATDKFTEAVSQLNIYLKYEHSIIHVEINTSICEKKSIEKTAQNNCADLRDENSPLNEYPSNVQEDKINDVQEQDELYGKVILFEKNFCPEEQLDRELPLSLPDKNNSSADNSCTNSDYDSSDYSYYYSEASNSESIARELWSAKSKIKDMEHEKSLLERKLEQMEANTLCLKKVIHEMLDRV